MPPTLDKEGYAEAYEQVLCAVVAVSRSYALMCVCVCVCVVLHSGKQKTYCCVLLRPCSIDSNSHRARANRANNQSWLWEVWLSRSRSLLIVWYAAGYIVTPSTLHDFVKKHPHSEGNWPAWKETLGKWKATVDERGKVNTHTHTHTHTQKHIHIHIHIHRRVGGINWKPTWPRR